jgi:cell division cycle protein 37
LQQTIAAMPEDEATYHMKRCVASGLWVPDAKIKEKEQEEEQNDAKGTPDPE